MLNFYPRPPRGGRREQSRKFEIATIFLSTPSARRATSLTADCTYTPSISIHALREEGDDNIPSSWYYILNFYPRPPRGGRLAFSCFSVVSRGFLSTPSARRATLHGLPQGRAQKISIHALREEGDAIEIIPITDKAQFLSTPSARRATHIPNRRNKLLLFLSTPSARRATKDITHLDAKTHFYPRPPRGGRRR